MKRKKNSRLRGSKTHGYGAKKKHRGAGNRGGRGNAGSGKRGDSNKPTFQTQKILMGKNGFKHKGPLNIDSIINVGMVSQLLPLLEKEGAVQKKGDAYEIDLGKAGYTKLLSKGTACGRFMVTVDKATPKAIEKIEAAGGTIANLKKDEPKKKA